MRRPQRPHPTSATLRPGTGSMIVLDERPRDRVAAMIELAAPEDPAVSVIVLLDGAVEMAERCLAALAACEHSLPFETVVVLNAPSPELEAFVRDSTRG